ncbi:MAG: DUF1592 domain-containing protein [Planctomycetales bacterium]|nr:DUF1592 domain-containing protein [Planctomycetales bacterium]
MVGVVAAWLAVGLVRLAGAEDEPRAVLRRLNRAEYENTIRDLLGVQVDFSELLPRDTSAEGFDNVGEALHISSFLLDRYLEAAQQALDLAIANGPQPRLIRERYSLKQSHQVRSTRERVFQKSEDEDRVVMLSSSRWQAVSLTPFYPPDAGRYRFRISAEALRSDGKPVSYRVDAGLMLMTGKQHLVSYFDAVPGRPSLAEFVEYLEPRNTIRILPYGLAAAQTVHKIGADDYQGPGLAIDWIEVEGPLHDRWPPESHRRIFGDLEQSAAPTPGQRDRVEVVSSQPRADAERILRAFCRRAFRRTVSDTDVAPLLELVNAKLEEGRSFEQAVRTGLAAALVSPQFLYLNEPVGTIGPPSQATLVRPGGTIDDFALASRLSYFLWSSMPDEPLLELAEHGRLRNTAELRRQVERMLDDPKSSALVKNFVGQWLNLRDINFTQPSHLLYPEYDDMLQASLTLETELFFAEVLRHDLSVSNFVHSDFSMLNGRLARHYGVDGVEGWEFRRVALPEGSHRGGVLTMGSVLKVTANGTYTSPVVRGAFVLDRILGTPAPPPPENVAGLVPDTRGATTIREQLDKHRNDDACSVCHVEIDPPGFALESFDVLGGWREHYRLAGWRRDAKEVIKDGEKMRYYHGAAVDSTGELPDGRRFQSIDEFKQLLLADRERIARALASRLVTYATGAPVRQRDRPRLDALVARAKPSQYGLRSLIHEIVADELFQSK